MLTDKGNEHHLLSLLSFLRKVVACNTSAITGNVLSLHLLAEVRISRLMISNSLNVTECMCQHLIKKVINSTRIMLPSLLCC